MDIRTYGREPFKVAVLHGGPGAPGYMAPVARELSREYGVIEPLQSATSLDGQLDELHKQLTDFATEPVTLIGSSWGAVLALLFATRQSLSLKKLILIGSAVFDAKSSASIGPRRLERLSPAEVARYKEITSALEEPDAPDKEKLMEEWGSLLSKTDMFDPLTTDLEVIDTDYRQFANVWPEFVALRDRPNYLATEFAKIEISVSLIHGEHDPHPIDGIRPLLKSCLRNVNFHILPNCGHYPWVERQAKDHFYQILTSELDLA